MENITIEKCAWYNNYLVWIIKVNNYPLHIIKTTYKECITLDRDTIRYIRRNFEARGTDIIFFENKENAEKALDYLIPIIIMELLIK